MQKPQQLHLPKANDIYMIQYTSGTTGLPKGVILTHANVVANISAVAMVENKFAKTVYEPGDAAMSFLPLAHVFDQVSHWFAIFSGGKIGYYRGDIMGLMDDCKQLKPVFMPIVPRLLNRIYDQVIDVYI